MPYSRLFSPLGLALVAALQGGAYCADSAVSAWNRFQRQSAEALRDAGRGAQVEAPLPESVAALRFQDFFVPVVGDRGLEYSGRMRALDGRRVRITGFLVRDTRRHAGSAMLAPWPTRIENDGYCYSEDYPPATLHLQLEGADAPPIPYRPGPVTVIGTLSVAPQPAADGRNAVALLRVTRADAVQAGLLPEIPH